MASPPRHSSAAAALDLFGTRFSSPVLMASGTCGFGEPVVDVMSPSEIGGLVTKSVTVEPRWGNPAPRVAEFEGGMLNSVGLANPGAKAVRDEKLPWMRQSLDGLPVFVSVAGAAVGEYAAVVSGLDGEDGFVGFELNLSCPNDAHLGGRPFCLDPDALRQVLDAVRPLTDRALLVKLAPNDPDIAATAVVAAEHGADGITAINTVPGFLTGRGGEKRVGAGTGGTSGPALLPVGLAAVREVAGAVEVPVIGVGGILSGRDARAYLRAGASLVQVGTGSFADPRCAARVARDLAVHSAAGTDRGAAPHEAPQ